jgi:hypothetical protein
MRKKLVASVLLLVIAISVITYYVICISPSSDNDYKSLSSYVAIAPYSWPDEAQSISQNLTLQEAVNNSVLLAKQMGFHGIAVHNVELYYLDNYLDDFLEMLRSENMEAAIYISFRDFTQTFDFKPSGTKIPLSFWSVYGFPNNTTQVRAYLNITYNITQITRMYSDVVKFYLVYYPWNWGDDYGAKFIDENLAGNASWYREYFQDAISAVKGNVGDVPVMPISDMIETANGTVDYIPYNLTGISGYAFDFYSHTNNTLDQHGNDSLEWYVNFWNDKVITHLGGNGRLFLAEWGWQTNSTRNGNCMNEERKAELIKEELRLIYLAQPRGTVYGAGYMPSAYFSLHDFPPEETDWGLASGYGNYILRPGGEMMQSLLKGGST